MVKILESVSLKPYNTFGVEAQAKYFTEIKTVNDLLGVLDTNICRDNPLLILGGGSNILFTRDFKGLVIRIGNKGIQLIEETDDVILLRVAAGENWDEFVNYCITRNYWGLENLIAIPGNAGTAPVQNIGAYGVEQEKAFISCEAVNLDTKKVEVFTRERCEFSYRQSFLKKPENKNFIITSVTYKLSKTPVPVLSYSTLDNYLQRHMITNPTITDIGHAIRTIRESKLPDYRINGNAGSYFKNPIIDKGHFDKLRKNYPDVVSFPAGKNYKIAAGWLIEKTGWKGRRFGNCGVHDQQALVLINYGQAGGEEILSLAEKIKESVFQQFEITLSEEVSIY